MPDPDKHRRAPRWLAWSLLGLPLGIGIAIYRGWQPVGPDMVWATGGSDGRWMGLFICILLVGVGGMAVWNSLFARPLTPEEERLRDMMRDWQRERSRFSGGEGS